MASESFTGELTGSGSGGKVRRYSVLSSKGHLTFEANRAHTGPPTTLDEVRESGERVRQAAKSAFEEAKKTANFVTPCLSVLLTKEQCAQLQDGAFTRGSLVLSLGTCYQTIFGKWGKWNVSQTLDLELERIPDSSL